MEIFSDKDLKYLIARVDGGPSAGIVGNRLDQGARAAGRGHGAATGAAATTKRVFTLAQRKELQRMNRLLGNILLQKFVAEDEMDFETAKTLKIQADAMVMRIKEVKKRFQDQTNNP